MKRNLNFCHVRRFTLGRIRFLLLQKNGAVELKLNDNTEL